MWIFDATPLMYLAKAEALTHLDALKEPCLIPEPVYDEVVTTGLKHEYPDARRVEQRIEEDSFDVVTTERTTLFERLDRNPNLSQADVSVLVLAAERDATAVMDERYGRDVADTEGIATRGTAFLLLLLVKRDVITKREARTTIDAMMDQGWYCAPNLYAQIIAKLDTL
ncbi:DUF3368 domain-containing protein [halophilic archaeon]|nr:DUF3368 domain-containing protein [halophilic archaeon]